MGKNRQRRESSFALGRQDFREGRPFRWKRHPFMSEYYQGYSLTYRFKDQTILQWFREKFVMESR